jgi:GNAT superfamily N-acetyltransferase
LAEGLRIEKLNRSHIPDSFDCGQADLNRWFRSHAFQNQNSNSSQTYLAVAGESVVGYYSLSAGQVNYADAPDRLQKGLAGHPIPVVLLARLAVDLSWQKRRVGRGLLQDAVLRTIKAADIVGLRAMAVHAKDDEAGDYYRQFDFTASPTDPFHLFALMKDLRKTLGREIDFG